MKNLKQFNDYINESKTDNEIINGSGLFFWNSSLDKNTQIEIVNWYNNLLTKDKKFVDILREESADNENYNCNESEDN